MSPNLTLTQIKTIKAELLDLLGHLREEVRGELADQHGERGLISPVSTHDLGDEALADLDASINIANISRHLQEIRECQAALHRLETGDYGFCSDCGEQIELNRLKANPISTRCLACQSHEEHQHPEVHYASL